MKIEGYFYVLVILLICILSISAVSAADDAASDAISTNIEDTTIDSADDASSNEISTNIEDTTIDSVEEEIILDEDKLESTEETKLSESVENFSSLNYKINGNQDNIVKLDSDYAYDDSNDNQYKEGIKINRKVTIDGQNHTISGSNLARIFNITANDVTIMNINFINGFRTAQEGGAIHWCGDNGTVNNNTFTNNTAQEGGAIYWRGDNGTVNNNTFTQNQASGSAGAIAWVGDNGTVNNNTFTNNTAQEGGAIAWGGDNGTVNNNTFTNNTAQEGGAIFWCGIYGFGKSTDNGTVNNNTFTQNQANGNVGVGGGAIYWNGGDQGTINNNTFTQNQANGECDVRGGAIYWYSGDQGTINNNTFTQNQAKEEYGAGGGGAIHWHTGDQGTINNNTFTQNQGRGEGSTYYNEYYGNSHTKINNNIFLNNTGYFEIFFNSPEGSNADYNWFGNTVDNYANSPTLQLETFTTWLFLNATANQSTIEVFNPSEISFYLCVYNKSSGASKYDNTLLPRANLTISATKGTINNYGTFVDSLEYMATELGTASITATIENVEHTIELTNIIANPNLSVASKESKYNENATIQLSYKEQATGTVNVTLQGKKGQIYKFENMDLKNTITLPANILPDEYIITVEYSGDSNFNDATGSTKLTVKKIDIAINAKASDITYGEVATVNVNIDATGSITLNIDGKNYTTEIKNGKATINVPNLSVGVKKAVIYYNGNEIYKKNQKEISFKVNKINTKLNASAVTTTYNVKKNLVITLKDGEGKAMSGVKVTVNLGKSKQYTTDKNGQVKVAIGSLTPKTYTAKISFAGNNHYKASSTTAKVVVKKAKAKITAKAKTFKFENKNKKYKITLKNNKGKAIKKAKVSLKVAGKTYTAKTNSKGVATFKLKKLAKKGKYTAAIKYAGNKYYKKATSKAKIKVKKPVWKTLSKGSKEKATIKKIQRALKKNGYYISYKGKHLKVDGIYHIYTVKSVKEFQKAKKLKATGKVDYKTAKKLKIVS